jgi:hypothetical protein
LKEDAMSAIATTNTVSLGSLVKSAKQQREWKFYSRDVDEDISDDVSEEKLCAIDPDGTVYGLLLERGGWRLSCAITHFSVDEQVQLRDVESFNPALPKTFPQLSQWPVHAKAAELQDSEIPWIPYRDLSGDRVYFLWRQKSMNKSAVSPFALLCRIGGEIKCCGGDPLRILPLPPDVRIDESDEITQVYLHLRAAPEKKPAPIPVLQWPENRVSEKPFESIPLPVFDLKSPLRTHGGERLPIELDPAIARIFREEGGHLLE